MRNYLILTLKKLCIGLLAASAIITLHYQGLLTSRLDHNTEPRNCLVCEENKLRTVAQLSEEMEKTGRHTAAGLSKAHSQINMQLLTTIREKWLKPPSDKPYNIPRTENENEMWGVKKLHVAVLNLLQFKKNGFFIECGAYDGVFLSNTLHLERSGNWTGLLIEADPNYFELLSSRHRKAWIINACLATNPYPERVKMTRIKGQGALSALSEIKPEQKRHANAEEFETQCFPLASILAAMGQSLSVDYLSLDIEGAELRVLQTIPWDYVYIKVISLESDNSHIGDIVKFLAQQNYLLVKYIKGPWVHDYIFVHRLQLLQLPQHVQEEVLKLNTKSTL